MLRITTGPFHPDLEQALVEEVRTLKAADPLTPLTIVVPSDPLRRRLKWLLCVEHQLALFDVHFLTFHQLAVRLLQEAGIFDPACVRSEFFYRELVHQLLRMFGPSGMRPSPLTLPSPPLTPPSPPSGGEDKGEGDVTRDGKTGGLAAQWADLAEMPGAWGALLATLKDLKDARVDPEQVGDLLSQSDIRAHVELEPLLALYEVFLDRKTKMEVMDQDDLPGLAEPYALQSAFLRRQGRIVYYGFYDATQIQLDLFQTIARSYPTTLFFPLVNGHPAYGFARRFFERHLMGLAHQVEPCDTTIVTESIHDHGSLQPGQLCRVLSTSGPFDELTIVAKDILSLVEERGVAFQDIGVVCRTLAGYETLLPRIFEQHAIPFSSTLARPLSEWPFVKAYLHLLNLRASGFRRDQVIELLSSPFLRLQSIGAVQGALRPDLWDLATRRLGITKGTDEWAKLVKYLDKDLPLRDDEDEEGKEPEKRIGPHVPSTDIRSLWAAVSALSASLDSIPDSGTWEQYGEQIETLCAHWLDVAAADRNKTGETLSLADGLSEACTELRGLSAINQTVTFNDCLAAFHRLMEETLRPIVSPQRGGVQVLDAMAARGVTFRALYVLGLNEKVFPRHIREDAFLRDRTRRLLEVDLGFKIQEKLGGYDEETLLFTLLCQSAREHLTLLYQRTDEAGRTLLPSAYLADIQRSIGSGEQTVPRRLMDKFRDIPHYHPDRLTPSELAAKSLLMRQAPRRLLQEGYAAGRLVARALPAVVALDGSEHRLGSYDGITGPLAAAWQAMQTSGVSPTALQEYAICPFRYFAKQVLRLRPLTVPESIDQIGPAELGTLAHSILRRCLETLSAQGYFSNRSSSNDPLVVLNQAAQAEFDRFAETHPVGYPLVWRLHQKRLLRLLRDALLEDVDEMAQGGWQPVLFEKEMAGTLPALDESDGTLAVAGRLDRVDWSSSRNAYRIVDYKFKTGGKPGTLEKNLMVGAVRARRLQPPLYLTMADALAARMPGGSKPACEGVWFYYLAPEWETPFLRVGFPGHAWRSSLASPMMQAITHVLSGIRSGRFFIYASGSCEHCDYRLLCRKSHQPTVWRARLDHAVVGPYRTLRSAPCPKLEQGPT